MEGGFWEPSTTEVVNGQGRLFFCIGFDVRLAMVLLLPEAKESSFRVSDSGRGRGRSLMGERYARIA